MNELDTEIMAGLLEKRGLTKTDDESIADLLLYNTCSIRDLAERKVMGKLGQLGKTPQKNALIGVTGCMANAKKEKIFQKIPYVDFVLGTNNIHQLNEVIDETLSSGSQKIHVDQEFTFELDYSSASRDDKLKANVSIIRGCDKYCTYCVVPYTRGPEVSRSKESIIEECQTLVDKGYKEITLLGQNVNSYGKDKPEWNTLFHDLLYELDKIKGLERIRFMTSHPVDISKELMLAIRDLPSLCEFVHFPFQSGSNRILKKMHRIYTVEQYLEKVHALKEIVPNISLGTDIIVGFPTETEEEFQETALLLEKVKPTLSFIFAYSARKGTPAIRWKDDISEEVKKERVNRLMELQEKISLEYRSSLIGKTVEVLVENNVENKPLVKGRSRNFDKVCFPGNNEMIGTLQNVKITGCVFETLIGEITS